MVLDGRSPSGVALERTLKDAAAAVMGRELEDGSIGGGRPWRCDDHFPAPRYLSAACRSLLRGPNECERQPGRDQLMRMVHELEVQMWLGGMARVAAAGKHLAAAYLLARFDGR